MKKVRIISGRRVEFEERTAGGVRATDGHHLPGPPVRFLGATIRDGTGRLLRRVVLDSPVRPRGVADYSEHELTELARGWVDR